MRTIKLTLSYDGSAYWGWQSQPDKPTVQETVELAIQKVTGETLRVLASGRTDTGVHALGQVASFRTASNLSPAVFLRAINANLPFDIAVLDATEVAHDFHPIRDAVRKRYRYIIQDGPVRDVFMRRYAWQYNYGRLNAEAMHCAAQSLLGTHDFSSFESSGAERVSSVRTISDLFVRRVAVGDFSSMFGGARNDSTRQDRAGEGGLVILEVESNGFLYNMVRAIVGTLVQVGRGSEPENWVADVLHAQDRSTAGPTAPPQGLFLVRVDYRPESLLLSQQERCGSPTSSPE